MTDMMYGPTLRLPNGKLIQTRLFGLLDDCSRVVPHAQYYDSEKLYWFLDCFRQGLAQRGFPDKLYTDQGKIFTSYHLQVVCANLGVRLCHAKPYAAWSKGKQERWFSTLQMDFEARLIIDPVHTLEELNARLWRWIETEYHQRPHSALGGQTPAERFAQRALELARRRRPHRLGSPLPVSSGAPGAHGSPPSVWRANSGKCPSICAAKSSKCASTPSTGAVSRSGARAKLVGPARRCDKQLNSKTYTDRDYDRPDKSS